MTDYLSLIPVTVMLVAGEAPKGHFDRLPARELRRLDRFRTRGARHIQ